ncbi:hypothetical protein OKA05_08970 [Luteolibacter arcticus]|uniref:Uncharacterized protein n=1 Tax=Luteolibacter arcticus TaxID=1581411 RepID=A0ABT3GHD8_9BACT|nr:hypothetical protein [Luteolibacter arcticus]MCW1922683.1 hypothetical protein [Luteolibacter arcticus]
MATPPLPVAPKKSGCLKIGLIIVGCLFVGFVGLAVIGWMLTSPEDKARIRAEREAREVEEAAGQQPDPPVDPEAARQAAEASKPAPDPDRDARIAAAATQQREKESTAKAKREADAKAATVPYHPKSVEAQVEEIARSLYGERFKSSTAWQDPKSKTWSIQVNITDESGSPAGIQRGIVKLAAYCHPEGLQVSDFTVGVFSSLTDGLGNKSEGSLVVVSVNREAAARINWKNHDEIDFHRAFDTTKVLPSYREKWEKSELW